jgi:hypothetical protein
MTQISQMKREGKQDKATADSADEERECMKDKRGNLRFEGQEE